MPRQLKAGDEEKKKNTRRKSPEKETSSGEIKYNWKRIREEYEKLRVPDDVYIPPFDELPLNAYFIGLSPRSVGKTTGWLLLGMVMFKLYGTVIQYLRATADELKGMWAQELFKTINTFREGEYVKILTNGEYNAVDYYQRAFYYCLIDETGKVVEKAPEPFCRTLIVRDHDTYKSTYNAPKGDLIIFDEFLSMTRRPDRNEPIWFWDLCKTIIRDRHNVTIVMLANNVVTTSIYFDALMIRKEALELKLGQSAKIQTPQGTRIFFEKIKIINRLPLVDETNRLYFGFDDPRLNAVTGKGEVIYDFYPLIPDEKFEPYRDDPITVICNWLFIDDGLNIIQIKECHSKLMGRHLRIYQAGTKQLRENALILSMKVVTDDPRYVWGFGSGKMYNYLTYYLQHRKVFYASNQDALNFLNYYRDVRANQLMF